MFSAREKTGYINSIIKDLGLCDVTLAEVKGQLKGRWQLSWAENVEDTQTFSGAQFGSISI